MWIYALIPIVILQLIRTHLCLISV
jgi:hypothetical protein